MELIIFIIVCVSCTVTFTRAEIFEWPKNKIINRLPVKLEKPIGSLMYCSQCLGFWVGFTLSWLIGLPISGIVGIDNIMLGFVSSYFSSLGDKIIYENSDEGD